MAEAITNIQLSDSDTDKLPFPSIIGQVEARRILWKALRHKRLAHAYLFTGMEGVGRMALALELARVLNCSQDPLVSATEDCDCRSCVNIRNWRHPNLIGLFPLPNIDKDKGEEADRVFAEIIALKSSDPYAPLKLVGTGRILIDQVREIRSRLSLTSDRIGKRVVIIQPADRMTDEASNAILKLLEEPPDDCCLLLITESIRLLMPTIVSRCQVIRFAPLKIGRAHV